MEMLTFTVRPVRAEESIGETIFAFFLLLLTFFILIGVLAFQSISQGHEMPLDVVYKPTFDLIQFIQSKL